MSREKELLRSLWVRTWEEPFQQLMPKSLNPKPYKKSNGASVCRRIDARLRVRLGNGAVYSRTSQLRAWSRCHKVDQTRPKSRNPKPQNQDEIPLKPKSHETQNLNFTCSLNPKAKPQSLSPKAQEETDTQDHPSLLGCPRACPVLAGLEPPLPGLHDVVQGFGLHIFYRV